MQVNEPEFPNGNAKAKNPGVIARVRMGPPIVACVI
jgi:hypothetical protein